VKFDALAQQFFKDKEGFARAIKLLSEYDYASASASSFAEFQKEFLDRLDDVTDKETYLLQQAFDYFKARSKLYPSAPDSDEKMRQIELAISRIASNDPASKLVGKRLSEAFELFINTHRQNWKSNSESEAIFRSEVFPLFLELHGDMDTTALTKEHTTEYLEVVLSLPKNRRKMPKYRDLSIHQIRKLKIPTSEQLSLTTKSNYITRLKTFLDWLANCDYARPQLSKPLLRTIKKSTTKAHEARNKYSDADLKKLFNSPDYTQGLHDEPFKYWVPLIGLFTGARENEICQLLTTDVRKDERTGIWVFDFNERDAEKTKKSVKNAGHQRLVPVHAQLQKLGFLDFVEERRKQKAERLFPELTYGESGKYADRAQKWFNRTYRARCGITTPNTSFHSLRHTHIHFLQRQVGLRSNEFAEYVGHRAVGNESDERYTKPLDLKEFDTRQRKLRFASIEFDRIRPWRSAKRGMTEQGKKKSN
jgi:integrase